MKLPRARYVLPGLTALVALVAVGTVLGSRRIEPAGERVAVNGETDHEDLRAAAFSSTGNCGVLRWSLKTGTDADAGRINQSSTTPTTIATQDAIPAPSTLPSNNRISPVETTVYSIDATIIAYALEADSDYHIVVRDGNGHTMITEIPDPACVGASSPFTAAIQRSRSTFDARFRASTTFQTANVPVRIRGVGFWDTVHGQNGVAPNGIELHPVLGISFGPGASPSPALAHLPAPGRTWEGNAHGRALES
jgi:hypothetical protein